MYLGVRAVLTKSFARIHLANLINFGILPVNFANENDYSGIDQNDELELDVSNLSGNLILKNITKGTDIPIVHSLSSRDIAILKAGGSLGYAKSNA